MEVRKGYKLFRIKKSRPGELFPLYVNANQSIPIGIWMKAECGDMTDNGKVKSRLGELQFRPGWHINDGVPYVSHIGIKENGSIKYMRDDTVWCEVEYIADIDYQLKAYQNGYKNGKLNRCKACLNYVPENGFYKYKTNPKMQGEWIIAGNMKIVRVLDDDQVLKICTDNGCVPLPRKSVFDYSVFGLTEKGA